MDIPDAGEGTHNVNVGLGSSGCQGLLQLCSVPVNKPMNITFTKELTVCTWGLGWQRLTTNEDSDSSSPSMRMLQTRVCLFPTNDDLHVYMTETEYNMIPV
jgi:hypothetical protein